MGWNHKEIANEVGRSIDAISSKASNLQLKSIYTNKITNKDIDAKLLSIKFKRLDNYINLNEPIRFNCLKCNGLWIIEPRTILRNNAECPTCKNIRIVKEIDSIIKEFNIKRIDEYKNKYTKINFNCLKCNNIWKAETRNIINNKSGCPTCAKHGFNPSLPAVTYCIYFKELDLYKIGISNNYKKRMKQFGYIPEIIFIREFELGKCAKELEKKWLESIKEYKINTEKLHSGNMETFRI